MWYANRAPEGCFTRHGIRKQSFLSVKKISKSLEIARWSEVSGDRWGGWREDGYVLNPG